MSSSDLERFVEAELAAKRAELARTEDKPQVIRATLTKLELVSFKSLLTQEDGSEVVEEVRVDLTPVVKAIEVNNVRWYYPQEDR